MIDSRAWLEVQVFLARCGEDEVALKVLELDELNCSLVRPALSGEGGSCCAAAALLKHCHALLCHALLCHATDFSVRQYTGARLQAVLPVPVHLTLSRLSRPYLAPWSPWV